MTEKQLPNETRREIPEIMERLNKEVAYIPQPSERPQRCRAIIFNPDGTKILGIVRQRPGRETYTVYPGGGVEDEDETAVAAVRRELSEELDLDSDDVYLTGGVLRFTDEIGGDQFYYIGLATEEFEDLVIHGPEAGRDPNSSGTYAPQWISVAELQAANMQPPEVTRILDSNR
jgi:8-oxo-dGTP pyrophosphatase MutT (NUDIX family)